MREDRYGRVSQLEWIRPKVLKQCRVMVVGAGAIGNSVLTHLALNGVGYIIIVDRDVIEETNLPLSPLYRKSDVDMPKARVAAERIKGINPAVRIIPIVGDIERDVGLGYFKLVDVVLGCVDSRRARMAINSKTWVSRRPYIDGGADGGSLTGRMQVFNPPDGACLECTWYERDYELLEEIYPCGDGTGPKLNKEPPSFSTVAAFTGSLMVTHLLRLFTTPQHMADDDAFEVRYNLTSHVCLKTAFRRRSTCLFDHDFTIGETQEITQKPGSLSVGDFRDIVSSGLGDRFLVELTGEIPTRYSCSFCQHDESFEPAMGDRRCRRCSIGTLTPSHYRTSLDQSDLEEMAGRPLDILGIDVGDILLARSAENANKSLFYEFVIPHAKEACDERKNQNGATSERIRTY